jgi:RNA polymerase sigma-70 factor (ECF subfamily)
VSTNEVASSGRPLGPPAAEGASSRRPSELSDNELSQALSAGESWAADAIYDRVEQTIDRVLFRLLGANDVDRDDLAQEVVARVITTIVSGKYLRGCNLRSWASLIAQNAAIDTMRTRRREYLMSALSTVKSTHAAAVVLHDVPGHSLAEIATLTGVSESAAQSRLVRGRKEVLRLLAQQERDNGENGH